MPNSPAVCSLVFTSMRLKMLLAALLLLSACKKTLPSISVLTDPDAFMTYRVTPYYTQLNKIKVEQIHLNDGTAPDTSGVTSSRELLKNHSAADVYWSGDALYCEYLKQQGLTIPYHTTSNIPSSFRDPDDNWVGLAPRIVVLLVRTDIKRANRPTSIRAYVDAAWKGKGVIADPLKGSMRAHFAELASLWGDQQLVAFYKQLRDNGTKIATSQEESADMVVEGDAEFALVDSDVALSRVRKNLPVEMDYPDQSPGEIGTLVMPNGLCIIKGCKNLPAARRLVDYLTSTEGERRITALSQAQVPLNEGLGTESPNMWRIEALHTVHTDYANAAKKLDQLEKLLPSAAGGKE